MNTLLDTLWYFCYIGSVRRQRRVVRPLADKIRADHREVWRFFSQKAKE